MITNAVYGRVKNLTIKCKLTEVLFNPHGYIFRQTTENKVKCHINPPGYKFQLVGHLMIISQRFYRLSS